MRRDPAGLRDLSKGLCRYVVSNRPRNLRLQVWNPPAKKLFCRTGRNLRPVPTAAVESRHAPHQLLDYRTPQGSAPIPGLSDLSAGGVGLVKSVCVDPVDLAGVESVRS